MDDTTTIGKPDLKLTVKGTEYPMTMPDEDTLARLFLVLSMDAGTQVKMQAAGALIKNCIGEKAWDTVMGDLLKGRLDGPDILAAFDQLLTVVTQIADKMEAAQPDA